MTVPTTATGYMDDGTLGIDGYGTVLDWFLEQIPELTHPLSVQTYGKMRRDPQIAAILRAYMLSIRRGNSAVDPAGCRDEVVQQIADDFGLPIKGYREGEPDPDKPDEKVITPRGARRRGFTFAEHLRLAGGLSLAFGHAPFAQQWNDEGGRWRLGLVQERMPQTIADFHLNPDGTLKDVEQYGRAGQAAKPTITTANHELIWYSREREGSNYFGQSLIRECYGPWLLKDIMVRVLGTSNRRNGMGVWQVQAPPNAQPNQIAEAQRIAAQTKVSEGAGIGLPSGFTAKLVGMLGTLPDTLGFINYLDRQMTRSTLTSILDMATAERGSRSLGETVMQLMIYAQQAEADRLAQDATRQIAIPLVDGNWGDDEPAPRIVIEDVGADDQLTSQDMNLMLQYGGLTPDDTLEEDFRKRKHLPAIDHASRRLEITTQPPVDPNAPTPPEGDPNA